MAKFDGLCSADMYPIDTDLEAAYLLHWMLTPAFTSAASAQQARTVLPKINSRSLYQLLVPVPPAVEQRRIVEALEENLSRVAAGDAYLDAAQRRTARLTAVALEALLERESSSYVRLGDLLARVEAGKSFGSRGVPAAESEWGIIRVSAITSGRFRPEENKAVDASQADPRYEVKAGDVLLSRANTTAYVGASVRVGDGVRPRLLLSDKSLRLVPHAEMDAGWLQRVLAAPGARSQMSARATGTKDSMRNIAQGALMDVTVPWVEPHVQRRLNSEADALEAGTDRLADVTDVARARAVQLRRALLQAAFTGRLTGRSSDHELLDEIGEGDGT